MNLALLGGDPESIDLAAAAQQLGHHLVWAGDFAWATELWPEDWPTDKDQAENWEALLDVGFCDAVILGRSEVDNSARQEQLAQLVKNGIPVLATFPLFDSVLSYYEIDMVRCESGSTLLHYNPFALLAGSGERSLSEQLSEVGRIEQVRWERPLADRTRENVLRHFARDVAILESVAGRLDRLGAHGSGEQSATYAGLSIQVIGSSQIPAQWSVRPGSDDAQATLHVITEQGEHAFAFDAQGQGFREHSETEAQASADPPPAQNAIRLLERAHSTRQRCFDLARCAPCYGIGRHDRDQSPPRQNDRHPPAAAD